MQIFNWWPGRRADIEARRLIHAFYQGFLRREPDPPGLESHVTALIAGRSAADIAEEFLACAEFKARNVKLFVPPGHHYSPIVDPAEASQHLDRLATRGPQFALPGIEVDRDRMFEEWRTFLPFFATMPFDASPKDGLRYGFDNPAYSRATAASSTRCCAAAVRNG